MPDQATAILQTVLPDTHLALFARRLTDWLLADLVEGSDRSFPESRAKTLLRATNGIDDPTLKDFSLKMTQKSAVRLAIHSLLQESQLAEHDEVHALAVTTAALPAPESDDPIPFLQLAVAAFAFQRGYALNQLDPASPPAEFSPAGQIIKRAGNWVRQEVLRTATERDKLSKKLAFSGTSEGGSTPTLETLSEQSTIAPIPPHFRPPIPVTYPEVVSDTVKVDSSEPEPPASGQMAVPLTHPITITEADLTEPPAPPTVMPPIRISEEQVASTTQKIQRQIIQPTVSNASSFATAVQRRWSSNRERMTTTKLRVVVQANPDSDPMFGLQVRISCQGVRSHVAGTTNRNGAFMAELPVRMNSGLTYDVEVTWPRDFGGEKERKSVTLNADRTLFELPFYRYHSEMK